MKVVILTGLQQAKIGIKVMEVAQNKQMGETMNQKANQINKKYIYILKNKTKTLRWIDQTVMGDQGGVISQWLSLIKWRETMVNYHSQK